MDRDLNDDFALENGYIMAMSSETLQVKTIRSTREENLLGMAYEGIRDRIYWSTAAHKIYRAVASHSNSNVETVLSTTRC